MNPSQNLKNIGRQVDGTAGAGNLLALKHGRYSRQLAGRPELQAEISERERAILADLGGPETLSAVAARLVSRYAETSLLADSLAANVFTLGPLTAKGKARAAVSLYLQVLDRQHRLAMALGLARRERRVPSLSEYLTQRAEEAAPGTQWPPPREQGEAAAFDGRLVAGSVATPEDVA